MNTNNMTVIIPFHSWLDLVTNSSSESFVAATNNTIKTAKNIVNSLLGFNASVDSTGAPQIPLSCDDLFNIDIGYDVDTGSYDDDKEIEKIFKKIGVKKANYEYTVTESQAKLAEKEYKKWKKAEKGGNTDGENDDCDDGDDYSDFSASRIIDGNDDGYVKSALVISVKDGLTEENTKKAEKIAKLLESFVGTYSIEASSNY